jgi:hypothetical protein
MHIPKRLYEALPWIYVAAGFVVFAALRNWIAAISGSMLVLTGALVLVMRARFRRPLPEELVHVAPARSVSELARQRAISRAQARRTELAEEQAEPQAKAQSKEQTKKQAEEAAF